MLNDTYIKSLLKPVAGKQNGRKVWSVDLETVWLPFFTATNTAGDTAIPHDALGAPLRLAYAKDGSVKFSNAGKPVIRVAKDLSDNVKLVRENFIAGLQTYTHDVFTMNPAGYKATIAKSQEVGKPIIENDRNKLAGAYDTIKKAETEAVEKALAHAEKAEAEAEKVLQPV